MRKHWAIGLSVAVVAVGVWAFARVAWIASRGGESAPLYSTERYDPYGTAALRQLLIERGRPVRTLRRPRLRDADRGVLIQILNLPDSLLTDTSANSEVAGDRPAGEQTVVVDANRLAEMTTEDLADWIAQGNTVIQMTRLYTELMDYLKVPRVDQPTGFQALAATIEQDQRHGKTPSQVIGTLIAGQWTDQGLSWLARDAPPMQMVNPRSFGPDRPVPGTWQPLVSVLGKVAVGQVRHGRGRLIVVGCPTPALNYYLAYPGNLRFMLAAIGDQPVIFDDWQHGVGRMEGVMDLVRRYGLLPFLGQVVLVMVVYHWSTRGLARLEAPRPERWRSSVEQIHTLGALYRRSLDSQALFSRVEAEVRRRLAAALRCPADQIESRLGPGAPVSAERAQALLARLAQLRQGVRGSARRAGLERELAMLLEHSHELVQEKRT